MCLRRISESENNWSPIVRHGLNFQPPQYIAHEIAGGDTNFGVQVELDGEDAVFYHSLWVDAGRVTFEIKPNKKEKHGLETGWYYISQNGNRENLNHTLEPDMRFQLIP